MPHANLANDRLPALQLVKGPRHRRPGARCLRCRAEQGGSNDSQSGSKADASPVTEDVLAKLRQFEEENKKLKSRLQGKVKLAAQSKALVAGLMTELAVCSSSSALNRLHVCLTNALSSERRR
jgi:hypothetical protein